MIVERNAIKPEKGVLYYLKGTDVWSYSPKTKTKKKLKSLDFKREKGFLYYLDKAGNVAKSKMKRK